MPRRRNLLYSIFSTKIYRIFSDRRTRCFLSFYYTMNRSWCSYAHILQCLFTGSLTIVRLHQCRRGNTEGYIVDFFPKTQIKRNKKQLPYAILTEQVYLHMPGWSIFLSTWKHRHLFKWIKSWVINIQQLLVLYTNMLWWKHVFYTWGIHWRWLFRHLYFDLSVTSYKPDSGIDGSSNGVGRAQIKDTAVMIWFQLMFAVSCLKVIKIHMRD